MLLLGGIGLFQSWHRWQRVKFAWLMFRNDYQRDDSREGHREVGDKNMRWTRGSSPWANEGWIYVTIQKQRDGEGDEEANHGNKKKKLCVTEKKWKDNGCRSQLQLPPCKPFRPTDVQANDCHSANLRQLDGFVHNSSKTSVSVWRLMCDYIEVITNSRNADLIENCVRNRICVVPGVHKVYGRSV